MPVVYHVILHVSAFHIPAIYVHVFYASQIIIVIFAYKVAHFAKQASLT